MLHTLLIQPGTAASQQLETMLIGDLHAIIWRHDSTDQAGADLRDYVIGAARSIRANLNSAIVQLACYEEIRYKLDNAVSLALTATGSPPHDPRAHELSGRLNAHQQGLLAALGAALDCMAAVCVAVSGLRMNVQRAQMPALLPQNDAVNFPAEGRSRGLKDAMRSAPDPVSELQHRILRGVAGAYKAAGPAGWLRWMLDSRNTAVHREQPSSFIFFERDRKTGTTVHRKLLRHPQMTNLQGMRVAGTAAELVLDEDARTTLRGCIAATSTFVHGVGAVIETEWAKRRIALDIRVPVDAQWDDSPLSAFAGFDPGSATFTPGSDTILVMHPSDVDRLRAGGVIE